MKNQQKCNYFSIAKAKSFDEVEVGKISVRVVNAKGMGFLGNVENEIRIIHQYFSITDVVFSSGGNSYQQSSQEQQ